MKWSHLIRRELFQRKNKLVTSALAVVLGIAVVVAINNINTYSEKAVAKNLDALGANVLILPNNANLMDYYSADLEVGTMPEEWVSILASSDLQGLDNLSPKLSVPVTIDGERVTLTGILPKNEFEGKASWKGAGIFTRPKGCGAVKDLFGLAAEEPKETLVRKRVIQTLNPDEVLVGAEVAQRLQLQEGSEIALFQAPFKVVAVLPQTGTVDDTRIFAHLHRVQELSGKGSVINIIEVVGCCQEISKGLVGKIDTLLPDAKVVTIKQIVDTQVDTNRLMKQLSRLFLVIIVAVGAATIANDMYNNVYERRKEIGTLVALGASPKTVLAIFLRKALIMGLCGGVGGYLLGTLMAVLLGPLLAGVPVLPMPSLFLLAMVLALLISLAASYFPARYATQLDPCTSLQEI